MKELEFEEIGHNLQRTKVPGGWLVRDYRVNHVSMSSPAVIEKTKALTFIPDPEYLWLKE